MNKLINNEVRDVNKQREYFEKFICNENDRTSEYKEMLNNGEVHKTMISIVKSTIVTMRFDILIARYSNGDDIYDLKDEFMTLVGDWLLEWSSELYTKNLWFISMCILFNVDNSIFTKIKEKLKDDGVNDWIYNFLLNYPAQNIGQISGGLMFKKSYLCLKELIESNCENERVKLMKKYLKEWYKNHNDCGWHNSHKGSQNTYYGYWSFESRAVVKLLGIPDDSFNDDKYYPADFII